MRIKVGAATDVGRVRKQNEDAFALAAEHGLLVVCDGMGGTAFGEVASQLAVTTIIGQLNGSQGSQGAASSPIADDDGGYLPQTSKLAEAVRSANTAIFEEAQNDETKSEMGTTVVAVWVGGDIASVARVGDSRAYLWRKEHFEPLTRDHAYGAVPPVATSESLWLYSAPTAPAAGCAARVTARVGGFTVIE